MYNIGIDVHDCSCSYNLVTICFYIQLFLKFRVRHFIILQALSVAAQPSHRDPDPDIHSQEIPTKFQGHSGTMITHSLPISEVGSSNPRPCVGKMVVYSKEH